MSKIPFKAVAVDMDGTFTNSQKQYDRDYFQRVLTKLKENHIHFIVASGRPLIRLKRDFEGFLDKIDLIADNGGLLVQDNNIINSHYFTHRSSIQLVDFIQTNYPNTSIIANGLDNSYMKTNAPVALKKQMSFYYLNSLISMNDLTKIPSNERINKLSLWTDVDAKTIERTFNKKSPFKIHVTSSGFNFTDVMPNGVNKASAIKYFLRYFNVKPEELIAFGDGMNDAEMLQLAGYSYAMANADPDLKKIAKYEAPSNDDNGVLKVLDQYLDA